MARGGNAMNYEKKIMIHFYRVVVLFVIWIDFEPYFLHKFSTCFPFFLTKLIDDVRNGNFLCFSHCLDSKVEPSSSSVSDYGLPQSA